MDLSVSNPKVVQTENIPYVYNIILTEMSPAPGHRCFIGECGGGGFEGVRGRGGGGSRTARLCISCTLVHQK